MFCGVGLALKNCQGVAVPVNVGVVVSVRVSLLDVPVSLNVARVGVIDGGVVVSRRTTVAVDGRVTFPATSVSMIVDVVQPRRPAAPWW